MENPLLVHDFLSISAQRLPDKTALVCGVERWTYAELDQAANRVAHGLIEAGVRRGDRVAIFLDNRPETVIALYATLKAGAAFIMLNPAMKARKLAYVLNDSGARLLLADSERSEIPLEATELRTAPCGILWVGRESPTRISAPTSYRWEEMIASKSPSDEGLPTVRDTDLATLIYTSGSTGAPKGVICPHANVVSAARSIIQYLENTEDDVILNVLPLSFDYGLYQVLMTFMFGGTVLLEKLLNYLRNALNGTIEDQATGFPVVPTIVAMLLEDEEMEAYGLKNLRYMTNTGAALPEAHVRRIRTLLPNVRLYSMFGLTECKRVSYLPPEEIDRRPGSVGKPIPGCEAWVVDSQGRDVGPGEIGELVVRGSNVMRGYWNDPVLTARTFRPGPRPDEIILHTGDQFRKDEEGFLYFVGRTDDTIKVGGERVSPKEVENAISEIPGVAEVAVIGVPDSILGNAVKAFVVLSSEGDLEESVILTYCKAQLEPSMIPKYIELASELPKTPNGKIDKRRLQSQWEKEAPIALS